MADFVGSFIKEELFRRCEYAYKDTLPLGLSMKEPRRVAVKGSFFKKPFRNNSYVPVILQDVLFGESGRKKVRYSCFEKLICAI